MQFKEFANLIREKSKEKSSINPETGADEDVEQEEEIELLPLDDLKGNF